MLNGDPLVRFIYPTSILMIDSYIFLFLVGNMKRVILDLFYAGSETTSTSLDWAFLYMAEYPEIQRKCQLEIHEVNTYYCSAL